MMRTMAGLLGLGGLMLLAACGEKAQTTGSARKADGKVWESQAAGYDAAGYKPGDRNAWEAQMRNRATGQNEYAKDR